MGWLVLVLGGSVSGCSKKAHGSTGPSASATAGSTSTAGLPPIHIKLPSTAPVFGGRLEEEAAHRPTGTPTAEEVFGTLEVKGVALHDIEQYMGHTWHAQFCGGANTDKGVFLMVCEYGDAQSLAAGKDEVTKSFPANPRKVYTNKNTLVQFRDDARTPESAAYIKTLADIFVAI